MNKLGTIWVNQVSIKTLINGSIREHVSGLLSPNLQLTPNKKKVHVNKNTYGCLKFEGDHKNVEPSNRESVADLYIGTMQKVVCFEMMQQTPVSDFSANNNKKKKPYPLSEFDYMDHSTS